MMRFFGLTLPDASQDVAPHVATALAGRMAAAAAALERGATAAAAAGVRQDARDFLDARRQGVLRMPRSSAARACDEHARTLLRLTVDAPPLPLSSERLVA